jgi:hypothetical protein
MFLSRRRCGVPSRRRRAAEIQWNDAREVLTKETSDYFEALYHGPGTFTPRC